MFSVLQLFSLSLFFFLSRDDPTSARLISSLAVNPEADPELGMCVSVNPEEGFKWNTRLCTGRDKATFVCQLPGKNTQNVFYEMKFLVRYLQSQFPGEVRAGFCCVCPRAFLISFPIIGKAAWLSPRTRRPAQICWTVSRLK